VPVLAHVIEFSLERDQETFAQVPAAPAVFLLAGPESEPYVSKTANLRRRLLRLLGAVEERSRKLSLRDRVSRIEYSLTASDFESRLLLYKLLRRVFPKQYRDRLRLRPAPVVKLILENAYPRALVTNRIGRMGGRNLYYGPFPSRAAAEKFLNDSLDFFKMRRCDFELNPDPAFPGCIYSEMKMCLAPCFKGCTDEQYASEVVRVQQYLDSGGQSLRRELGAERERASTALEFEQAAALHARIEKLDAALTQYPDCVRRIDRLTGVIVQPAAVAEAVTLFRIDSGVISDRIIFSVGANAGETIPLAPLKPDGMPSGAEKSKAPALPRTRPQSMESRLQEALAAAPAGARASSMEVVEHLALLKRWCYGSNRTGEIFLVDERGELPMRRLVRGVSRVFRGEKPMPDLNEAARDYWINRGREAEIHKPRE
jgi:excinuclease ABC subunit C